MNILNIPFIKRLESINAHPRDIHIVFEESTHKYTIGSLDFPEISSDVEKYISVTTIIHSYFEQFNAEKVINNIMSGKNWNENNKYWGMTAEEIKQSWSDLGSEVTKQGTSMHNQIEHFMNQEVYPLTHENLLNNYLSELENKYPLPSKEHVQQVQESIKKKNKKQSIEDFLFYVDKNPQQPSGLNVNKKIKKITLIDPIDEKIRSIPESLITEEWRYFLMFVKSFPFLIPYRTEWMIYDEELRIAGSVDMVYKNIHDNTYLIYDWKRAKSIDKYSTFNKSAIIERIDHIPDTNYWHYTLQLNFYKSILEKNYGIQISGLSLVRLHPNNINKTFDIIPVPFLNEEIMNLFDLRKKR